MNNELMTELLALPRGRWMLLRQGLPAALSAALGEGYRKQAGSETPEGPRRVGGMGRVGVAGGGGSEDVYALCNMRQAPRNPYWDALGRLVVDKDTRLVELENPEYATPVAWYAAKVEREELRAELRELKAEREELLARAREVRADVLTSLEEELDEVKADNSVARDLVAMARVEVDGWTSRGGRVVASLLASAVQALDGDHE